MDKIHKLLYKFWNLDSEEKIKKPFEFRNDSRLISELENYINMPLNFGLIDHEDLIVNESITDSSHFDQIFEVEDVITKPKSKKDEIIQSLNYLKSKDVKTKQDRDSIYTLEMILKNMR
jgi:hypothetical protein